MSLRFVSLSTGSSSGRSYACDASFKWNNDFAAFVPFYAAGRTDRLPWFTAFNVHESIKPDLIFTGGGTREGNHVGPVGEVILSPHLTWPRYRNYPI